MDWPSCIAKCLILTGSLGCLASTSLLTLAWCASSVSTRRRCFTWNNRFRFAFTFSLNDGDCTAFHYLVVPTYLIYGSSNARRVGQLQCLLASWKPQRLENSHMIFSCASKAALKSDKERSYGSFHWFIAFCMFIVSLVDALSSYDSCS